MIQQDTLIRVVASAKALAAEKQKNYKNAPKWGGVSAAALHV